MTIKPKTPKCPLCGSDLKWGVTLQKFFCLNMVNCTFEATFGELVLNQFTK